VKTNRKLIRKFSSKAGENRLRGSEKPYQSVKSNISIKDISNFKNLVAGFELIKSNPGNITKGVTMETLDVIDLDYLLTIKRRLQDGKFKYGPARRIQNSTRPLTMPYLRENLVQKSVQLDLEPVYKEKFRDSSHGFRPGTKPAIQFLESDFHSSKYIIEAELSLVLNSEKIGIVNHSLKPVKFLAYNIMGPKGYRNAIKLKGRLISRRKKTRTGIKIDRSKVITILENLGLIRKRVSHYDHKNLIFRGTFMGNLINQDHADIIQYYNSIIIDIYNYYSFIGNKCEILRVYGLIKESCALTLARKFKIRTLRKLFSKFGSDLTSSVIGKNGATYTRSLISCKYLKLG
jgi:hypothetical protein